MFFALDRNLEDVDQFYNKKFQDISRRLKLLEDRYGYSRETSSLVDVEEKEDLISALLELRGQMRKLQWYGEVNRRGFIKITKKLDKNLPSARSQQKYLPLKVDPSPFATNTALADSVNRLNEWLSFLNDTETVKSSDTASLSSNSSKRATARLRLDVSPDLLAQLEQSIKAGDATSLSILLDQIKSSKVEQSEAKYQQFLKFLLQRAISQRSELCVKLLLKQIVFLDDGEDINKRNFLHRLVISIGRRQTEIDFEEKAEPIFDAEAEMYSFIAPANGSAPQLDQGNSTTPFQHQGVANDAATSFLAVLLSALTSAQRSGLLARDIQGKTPLHYAAQYGIKAVCEIIIAQLRAWNLFQVEGGLDGPLWLDAEGWAPIQLSAIGGHPKTTQCLLNAEAADLLPSDERPIRNSPRSLTLISEAVRANFVEVVRVLIQAGFDMNARDEQGETALHVAARFGHADCARLLLATTNLRRANLEVAEKTYGWTPLFVACVDGHVPIVEILIDTGADIERLDSSGWTPKEHAALRGHIEIATRLADATAELATDSDTSTSPSTSPPSTGTSLVNRSSNVASHTIAQGKPPDTFKTFGHRYLTNKSMVLVSLGTMNMRKEIAAVSLDRIPLASIHSTQLDTTLSIIVSAQHADGEPEIIDLPVQDSISTDPIVFHATDPTKVKILFDLVPTYAGTSDKLVGRAVALLSTIRPSIGSKKISLQGDLTVPIVAADTLDVIGSVTFNFLIITPFSHPHMTIKEDQTYWKSVASTMVIGHRGMGKNMAGRRSLQLGENTIESFVAAANLGASYVEFDVQLTKDHIPVIYHDFLVSETGIDAPVHTLTLEQFLHVSDTRTPRHSRPPSPLSFEQHQIRHKRPSDASSSNRLRRSASASSTDALKTSAISIDYSSERMKHTRDYKKKGFKGNQRGTAIQSPFATLTEMFQKLPPTVGFNIELKYPMLFETEDEDMDTYAIDLNSFIDTILQTVYDFLDPKQSTPNRNIIFSSFNPDICLLAAYKQPSIPVLFLTDAGTSPVGDIRASSLQEAIRFASRWDLLGVVSAAEPFVLSPRLVKVVKESGLVCVSYGTLNNDPRMVRRQVKMGIDAVIVDSVVAVRKGLTEDAQAEATAGGGEHRHSHAHIHGHAHQHRHAAGGNTAVVEHGNVKAELRTTAPGDIAINDNAVILPIRIATAAGQESATIPSTTAVAGVAVPAQASAAAG